MTLILTLINNNNTKYLLDILRNHKLTQHIEEPTRGSSCIDHIFSNIRNAVGSILPLSLSDHDTAQVLTFSIKRKNVIPSIIFNFERSYSIENIDKFKTCIGNLSFAEVYTEKNPNEAFNIFYDWFCLLYKLCFPICKVRLNMNCKLNWITKGIRKSCARNRYLRRDFNKKRNMKSKEKYLAYSKLLKKCILRAKKQNNNNFVLKSKNACKATWKIIQGEINSGSQGNNYINSIEYLNNIINSPEKNFFNI